MGTLCVLVSFPFIFMPAIGLSIENNCHNVGTYNGTTAKARSLDTVSETSIGNTTSGSGVEKCKNEGDIAVTAYYSAFVILFQFGWATVQISHLSMIPDITSNENSRMALTSIRYAATVMSYILVYSGTWLLLDTSKSTINLSNQK